MNKLKSLIESGLVDRGDGAIFDTRTNLLWQQSSSNKALTWQEATIYCKSLTLAGYKNWRLPTLEELRTLINKRYKPTIDPIFECKTAWYWSSSTYFGSPGIAWVADFDGGYIYCSDARDDHVFVRVVCG